MTCIVGLAYGGKVYIGGDSAGTNTPYQLTLRKDRKVFQVGGCIIGGTSSFRMLQLLRYSLCLPLRSGEIDISEYMATSFIDALRECFKAEGYASKANEQEFGGTFLIGYKGRLFCIYSDYQVEETIDVYNAVGCGSDIALGSLFATRRMDPIKRIETALKAAERHNAGVRGPFYHEILEA